MANLLLYFLYAQIRPEVVEGATINRISPQHESADDRQVSGCSVTATEETQ